MSPTIDSTLQVIFVDALFLCLAGGLAIWFRYWLQEQQRAMDRRLEALEGQQQALARICERLNSVCRALERLSPSVEAIARPGPRAEPAAPRPTPVETPAVSGVTDRQVQAPRSATVPDSTASRSADQGAGARRRVDTPAVRADRQWEELTDRSREAYRRARDLLEQGVPPNDIARQVGLGVAEVNVLKRMRDAGRH
jgi:hypothetical protein